MQQALCDAGRNPQDVLLLAVSKTRTASEITAAWNAGLRSFGENYLQEALPKINALFGYALDWHFIGPLQSNKAAPVAANFDWVHSVDRIKIAERLSFQRVSQPTPLNVCIQVNIDDEARKSGVAPRDTHELVRSVLRLPNLRLRGLMCIPALREGTQQQRQPYRRLRQLFDDINVELDKSKKLDTLSMGMSGDLEAAILEGATIVRIGTDIFGPRTQAIEN